MFFFVCVNIHENPLFSFLTKKKKPPAFFVIHFQEVSLTCSRLSVGIEATLVPLGDGRVRHKFQPLLTLAAHSEPNLALAPVWKKKAK